MSGSTWHLLCSIDNQRFRFFISCSSDVGRLSRSSFGGRSSFRISRKVLEGAAVAGLVAGVGVVDAGLSGPAALASASAAFFGSLAGGASAAALSTFASSRSRLTPRARSSSASGSTQRENAKVLRSSSRNWEVLGRRSGGRLWRYTSWRSF